MKALLAPLATLGLLLAIAGTAVGQTGPNQLGIYYDTNADIDEISISPSTQHVLYLVLCDPVNDSYDGGGTRDVALVRGFECGIVPPSGDYVLGVDFPLPAINVGGSAENIVAGYYGEGVPVTGASRTAVLASLSVMSAGNNATGWYLSPASPASLAGVMAYLDAEDPGDDLVEMMPAGGSFDQAVFWFGDWHVEEARQWGDVKALFR